jgi:hypothetical protein
MFKWLKKRKQIKKMKSLRKKINPLIGILETLRDETIIGEQTESKPIVRNADINSVIEVVRNIFEEIDAEIDDRTREREFLFKDKVKQDAL